jgi:peptide/nickel transport system permease protein
MCGILAAVGPYAKLIAGRVVSGAIVVVFVTAITWLLMHGLRADLFDDSASLPAGLADYLGGVFLHLDFGRSWGVGTQPVGDLLRRGIGADVSLMVGGLAVGLLGGLAGGVVSGVRAGRPTSRVLEAAAMVALCAPVYVVGLQLLLLFGEDIGKVSLPVGIPLEYTPLSEGLLPWLGSLIVPSIVVGLPLAGLCLRLMRAATVEALGADYVRTARAKGLRERAVLRRHVTPAAAAPAISLSGAAIPLMVTNIVLVENVFSIDGAFSDLNRSITEADMPLVLALTTLGALFIVTANLLVDLVLTWLDPRVRAAT